MWCVEGRKKAKDRTKDFESCLVIVWAIDVNDVIYEGYKRPVPRSTALVILTEIYSHKRFAIFHNNSEEL